MADKPQPQLYTEEQLTSFGTYMLNQNKAKRKLRGNVRFGVTHADFENWKLNRKD